MGNKSSTGVYNRRTKIIYESNLIPIPYYTAHERLLLQNSLNKSDCVGYSIKKNGSIETRSRSINIYNFNKRDASEYKKDIIYTRDIQKNNDDISNIIYGKKMNFNL